MSGTAQWQVYPGHPLPITTFTFSVVTKISAVNLEPRIVLVASFNCNHHIIACGESRFGCFYLIHRFYLNTFLTHEVYRIYAPVLVFKCTIKLFFFVSKKYKSIIDIHSVSLSMLALTKQN